MNTFKGLGTFLIVVGLGLAFVDVRFLLLLGGGLVLFLVGRQQEGA